MWEACPAHLSAHLLSSLLHIADLGDGQGGASDLLVEAMMDCEVLSTVWTKP